MDQGFWLPQAPPGGSQGSVCVCVGGVSRCTGAKKRQRKHGPPTMGGGGMEGGQENSGPLLV